MADWMVWLVLAGILVILELFSGTFYLLMLAIGLVAGALAALAGAGAEVQIILAAIVGVVATAILHRSRFGWQGRGDSESDPNVNLDVGQFIQIDQWSVARSPSALPAARATYRGAPWDVELAEETGAGASIHASASPAGTFAQPPQPGRYRIVAVRGSRLIVAAEI